MLVLMLPRVSSRVSGFPVASLCLWRKLKNLSLSKVSKQVVMLFCVAGAALCDIPTCLITYRESFCVAGAILSRRFQKMRCSFRGRRSTLDVSIFILRGRRSTLQESCWVLLRIALSGLRPVVTTCKFCGKRGWKPRTKHRF